MAKVSGKELEEFRKLVQILPDRQEVTELKSEVYTKLYKFKEQNELFLKEHNQ